MNRVRPAPPPRPRFSPYATRSPGFRKAQRGARGNVAQFAHVAGPMNAVQAGGPAGGCIATTRTADRRTARPRSWGEQLRQDERAGATARANACADAADAGDPEPPPGAGRVSPPRADRRWARRHRVRASAQGIHSCSAIWCAPSAAAPDQAPRRPTGSRPGTLHFFGGWLTTGPAATRQGGRSDTLGRQALPRTHHP